MRSYYAGQEGDANGDMKNLPGFSHDMNMRFLFSEIKNIFTTEMCELLI